MCIVRQKTSHLIAELCVVFEDSPACAYLQQLGGRVASVMFHAMQLNETSRRTLEDREKDKE